MFGWFRRSRPPVKSNAPTRSRPGQHKPGPRTVVVHSLKMHLDTREAIQSGMAKGAYEPEQTAWIRECLTPGDRFLDIGANFGWYAALAATIVGRDGEVIAFEPSPIAADVIARTVSENGLANVVLMRAGVGDKNGEMMLFMPVDDVVHSPSAFFTDDSFEPLSVPVVCLDELEILRDGRPIKLIKIDVEGSEPNVVRGMRRLAQSGQIANIFCEFNSGWLKRNACTPRQLFEEIVELGFTVHRKTELVTHSERNGDSFELQDIWFKWG